MAFDYKKEYKEFYLPRKKPGIVNVPEMRFLAVRGRGDPNHLSEAEFSQYLFSAGVPDPDLVIRPSGELRISNFLLWQSAYAEFYFTDVLWPDFSKDELHKALAAYQGRSRRFGGI